MPAEVLLITPPFTQLNTPYPATTYLKGFLESRGISSYQADLGIETTLKLFTTNNLDIVYERAAGYTDLSDQLRETVGQKQRYLAVVEPVIAFLQGKQPSLAHRIAARNLIPEGPRFHQLDDLDWAFGNMGVTERAKHLCTLFLEDIADLIKATVDPYFGFSRYAERLARSANSFNELYAALAEAPSFVDGILLSLLEKHLQHTQPKLVAITAPFPGNVYAAFRCAQYIRINHAHIKVAFGGGFANTELRTLKDARVFEFFDFVALDDGEAPIECLVKFVRNEISADALKRTYLLHNNEVRFINNGTCADYPFDKTGTPDYSDLPLQDYIHAIEIVNPMHSLWSNGRWNKLTMAHGCYWGKCTFCDISLPYIADYAPLTATVIVDKMEAMIKSTGETGFHFVDEAAPPALMRDVALEIVRRNLVVSWWTNIRFEKSFSLDLCLLLKASGCIGVSGGLEVASDRLLALIQKGVTIEQVAHVLRNFAEANIMVHAYLMYGFPTQTEQETIDSLEIVRQLFDTGILQSGFWHRFAMTAHSPVGLHPEQFHVIAHRATDIAFADNDIEHSDPTGADHDLFAEGLRVSLYNYMHGAGLDIPLQHWFEHNTAETTVDPDHIEKILNAAELSIPKENKRILFIGTLQSATPRTRKKRNTVFEETVLTFQFGELRSEIILSTPQALWLQAILPKLHPNQPAFTVANLKSNFEQSGFEHFELWYHNDLQSATEIGLLIV